jgi:hypothetical protein
LKWRKYKANNNSVNMNLIPHIPYSHVLINYIPWHSQSLHKNGKEISSSLILWLVFPYVCFWVYIVTLYTTGKKKPLFWEQNHEINLNRRPASEASTIDFFPTGQNVHSPLKAGITTEMFYVFPHCLHTNSGSFSKKAAHFTAPPPWILQQ